MQLVPLALLSLMALGMVGLIIGTTVNTAADPTPMAPQQFEDGDGDYNFQQHLCPCKNDWPLATNERLLSNAIFNQITPIPDHRQLSAMIAFWGQFIDHDIVLSDSDPTQGTFSIPMVPSDAILHATRNKFRLTNGCRDSRTLNTPMIDAGTVYGDHSNPDRLAQVLRLPNSCKLRTSAGNLMPLKGDNTFEAGDPRNTEHSFLASLHTLWVREHNRLCDEMPSQWSVDEKFWKARQVVVAKIQHITYEEWLPALFGSQMHLLSSVPMRGETTRITMEFSVSAYRYGHSQIPDPIGPFALPTLFFNAQVLIDNGIEPILGAAYTTPAESVNSKVVSGLRDFLFSAGPNIIGEDLVARNIFRGRELGLGTYAQIAECYGLSPLVEGITSEDPYIALLQEPLVAGSSLPRTIAHIVAEQFRRLKENDPRFYTKIASEIGGKFYQEVRETTLGKVIEANTGLENVPEKVFRVY